MALTSTSSISFVKSVLQDIHDFGKCSLRLKSVRFNEKQLIVMKNSITGTNERGCKLLAIDRDSIIQYINLGLMYTSIIISYIISE